MYRLLSALALLLAAIPSRPEVTAIVFTRGGETFYSALERIASSEASMLLKTLSEGAPSAPLTRLAKLALERR